MSTEEKDRIRDELNDAEIEEVKGKVPEAPDALDTPEAKTSEEDKEEYGGNSWVSMAMNPTRRKKLDKDDNYKKYQAITVVVALIILVVFILYGKLT